jgi:hypothetical protein
MRIHFHAFTTFTRQYFPTGRECLKRSLVAVGWRRAGRGLIADLMPTCEQDAPDEIALVRMLTKL